LSKGAANLYRPRKDHLPLRLGGWSLCYASPYNYDVPYTFQYPTIHHKFICLSPGFLQKKKDINFLNKFLMLNPYAYISRLFSGYLNACSFPTTFSLIAHEQY